MGHCLVCCARCGGPIIRTLLRNNNRNLDCAFVEHVLLFPELEVTVSHKGWSLNGQTHCVSPIESAKLELEDLKSELSQMNHRQRKDTAAPQTSFINQKAYDNCGNDESRSASLPSFPQSFQGKAS